MHTTSMKSGVRFHHNGGFDGDVLIVAPDSDDPKTMQTVRVDFGDIKALVAEYVIDKLERELEDSEDDEVVKKYLLSHIKDD